MDADERAELLDELHMLRQRVTELSESIADCRAQRLHQQALIGRLRDELRATRVRPPGQESGA
jgi:hypothetical protein